MALVWWLSWVLGCGLTLDLDPPDPQALDGADAAHVDGSRRDGGRTRDGATVDGSDLVDGPTDRDASGIIDASVQSDARLGDGPLAVDAADPLDAAWLDGYLCAGYICGTECCDPRSFEVCCDPAGGGDPYCAGMCL